eukprot:TRINITY_DN23353_c0_g1_i1.p1 TRINITY_DN23353_c0_g1~~TRINITY_DN23353_c0_g1_i1.p1  ORF type:complete len:348 (+),score=48.07 TRINITY_DN23353_c0_g1_i1:58-1101(+)
MVTRWDSTQTARRLMTNGTEDQDNAVYGVIVVTSLLTLVGGGLSVGYLCKSRRFTGDYTSKLLSLILIATMATSFVMLLTPNGYDSDDSSLPNTDACAWQGFLFVFLTEARWMFTVLMFLSETRALLSDTAPAKKWITHNILGWGLGLVIGCLGWLADAISDSNVYGWQWSGRCGVVSTNNEGALFLLCKVGFDLLILVVIIQHTVVASRYLYFQEQMRARSADHSILGMFTAQSLVHQMFMDHSLYYQIGFVGCVIKTISIFFEFFLAAEQLLSFDNGADGEGSVLIETLTTAVYGGLIFVCLFASNFRSMMGNMRYCCCGTGYASEAEFCTVAMPVRVRVRARVR